MYSFADRYGRYLKILSRFFLLSEPRLSYAYVSVLNIQYMRTDVSSFFALTANIAKIEEPPNISVQKNFHL